MRLIKRAFALHAFYFALFDFYIIDSVLGYNTLFVFIEFGRLALFCSGKVKDSGKAVDGEATSSSRSWERRWRMRTGLVTRREMKNHFEPFTLQ